MTEVRKFNQDDMEALIRGVTQTVSLAYVEIKADDFVALMRAMPHFEDVNALHICYAYIIDIEMDVFHDELATAIAETPGLRTVHLGYEPYDPDLLTTTATVIARAVAKHGKITELVLTNVHLDATSIQALGECTSLETLNVDENPLSMASRNVLMTTLRALPNLKELSMRGNRLSAFQMSQLCDVIATMPLHTLHLCGNDMFDITAMRLLRSIPKLEYFTTCCDVSPGVIAALKAHEYIAYCLFGKRKVPYGMSQSELRGKIGLHHPTLVRSEVYIET